MKLNVVFGIVVILCLQHIAFMCFATPNIKYSQDESLFAPTAQKIGLVSVDQYYTSKSLKFVYELNFDSPIQYWYPFSISGSIFGSNSSAIPPITLSDISVQLQGYAGLESYTSYWQSVVQVASYDQSTGSFESVVFPNGVMTGMPSPYVWTLLTSVNQSNLQFSDSLTESWVTERLPWYIVISIPLVPKTYAATAVTLDLSFTQWLENSLTPVTSLFSTQARASNYFSGKQSSFYSIPYIQYSDPTIQMKSKSSQSVVSSVEIFPEGWQYRLQSDINGTTCIVEKQECGYEYDYYSIDDAILSYQRDHQSFSTLDIEERVRILPNGKFAIADDVLTAKQDNNAAASGNNIYNTLSSTFTFLTQGDTTNHSTTYDHLNSTSTSAFSFTKAVEFSPQYYSSHSSYTCWKVVDSNFSFRSTYITARGGFRATLAYQTHFSGTRWVDCSSLGFESVNVYVYSSADNLVANFTTLALQPAADASSSLSSSSSSAAAAVTVASTPPPPTTTASATSQPSADFTLTTPTLQAASGVTVSTASTAAWQRLSSQLSTNLAVQVYNTNGDVVAYSSHSNHTPFPTWAIVVLIVVPVVAGSLLLTGLILVIIFCCTGLWSCRSCSYCCDDCCDDCCSCCDRDDTSFGTTPTPSSPVKDVEMAFTPTHIISGPIVEPYNPYQGSTTGPQPDTAPYSPYTTGAAATPDASSQFADDTTDYQPPPLDNDKYEPSVPDYASPEYASAPPME